MQKILFLSCYVPPDPSGSSIIALNLAKQFMRSEMVLAGEQPYDRAPVAWNDKWPEIVYVQTELKWNRGKRWWRKLQFPRTLWRTIRLMRREAVDAILAVYPTTEFLFIGYLASLISGKPIYAYFHNLCLEVNRDHRRFFASWLQRRIFRHAAHVFVMSDGMSEYFSRVYPSVRQSPLRHSFDEAIPVFVPPPAVGSPMRLIFCGSANGSCADALVRLVNAVTKCPDVQLDYVTGSRDAMQSYGLLRPGIGCEQIARDLVPARLTQADVVLLPHGFTGDALPSEEFQTIFPTKTIEYLICGRPILAHAPPESFLTKFLREHDCALIVDRPDESALCEAIERLRRDGELRASLVRNALRAAEFFRGPIVAEELRKRLGITQPAPHMVLSNCRR
jgi:glycosyltransferase involved in cell wall biosynthesis